MIASDLDTTRGAIYKVLHDARVKLRTSLGADATAVEIERVLITPLARLSSCMPDFLSLPPRSEAMRKQTFVVTELALERQARHAER